MFHSPEVGVQRRDRGSEGGREDARPGRTAVVLGSWFVLGPDWLGPPSPCGEQEVSVVNDIYRSQLDHRDLSDSHRGGV